MNRRAFLAALPVVAVAGAPEAASTREPTEAEVRYLLAAFRPPVVLDPYGKIDVAEYVARLRMMGPFLASAPIRP